MSAACAVLFKKSVWTLSVSTVPSAPTPLTSTIVRLRVLEDMPLPLHYLFKDVLSMSVVCFHAEDAMSS